MEAVAATKHQVVTVAGQVEEIVVAAVLVAVRDIAKPMAGVRVGKIEN